MFENLIVTLILAGIAGLTVSGLSVLGNKEGIAWDWRKFAYSLGVAFVAGLAVIETNAVPITEATVIGIFLSIIGTSFVGSKLVSMATRLKGQE